MSHTLRGCVDWNTRITGINCGKYRHTLRGCVDWNIHTTTESKPATPVTPCVGVWIETDGLSVFITYNESHPAWVCGLKQVNDSFKQCRNRSHTLRGCVDWNRKIPHNGKQKHQCHTLRGCVDWNLIGRPGIQHGDVTPCVGVWIETQYYCIRVKGDSVTPCVGVWIETL